MNIFHGELDIFRVSISEKKKFFPCGQCTFKNKALQARQRKNVVVAILR